MSDIMQKIRTQGLSAQEKIIILTEHLKDKKLTEMETFSLLDAFMIILRVERQVKEREKQNENKGKRESIEDIRANLYIADEAYNDYWAEWKHLIVKAVRKYELDKDIIYVFESDLQHEVDYLNEEGYSMEIVDNVDGLIFYKKLPKLNENKRS